MNGREDDDKLNDDFTINSDQRKAKRHVLIVDDDVRAARAFSTILASESFDTTVYHTGNEALRQPLDRAVHAAIIDIHLPDLNGLVLSQQLRDRLGPEIPIFVVSGDTSMETLNSLQHVGATHFFAKPMSPVLIVHKLRELLERV